MFYHIHESRKLLTKWENMIKYGRNRGQGDLKNLKLRSDVSNEILDLQVRI